VSREAPVLAREGGLATLLRTVLGHVRIDARLCLSLVGSVIGLQTCGDFGISDRRHLRARRALLDEALADALILECNVESQQA